MAASPYTPIFKAQPEPDAVVYIRLDFPQPPTLATWKPNDQRFELVNGLHVPWYLVADWKPS
jgi:hypothetical protein